MNLEQSDKLANVLYDVRGPALRRAQQLEEAGHRILKLNIGNPAPFGFEAPDELLQDMVANLPVAQGYSDSKGIPRRAGRRAVQPAQGRPRRRRRRRLHGQRRQRTHRHGHAGLLNDGDEVLVPAPDYPLWTAAVSLAGGRAVHYLCDESQDWEPDLEHLRAQVSPRTKAMVVINPNNPTGAVYGTRVLEGMLQVAREHGLLVLSDEIYDKILYDDAVHVSTASLAPDLLCITFNGLSKAYRVAGFRSGWMYLSGPKAHASGFVEGLDLLANMRLCANVPAQHVVQAALSGHQSINDLVLPGGRLAEQSHRTWELLNAIPGVSCVKPRGALYCFPRLDPEVHAVQDDYQLIVDLLEDQHVLVVQGTGFNWPTPDHFRIVTLPRVEDLENAVGRIGTFLGARRG